MFDLNRAIDGWRQPFLGTHLYGKRNIEELEDHLRESISLEIDNSIDAESAFLRAVDKVGTEPVLRPTFLADWKKRNPLLRYFLRLTAELAGLKSIRRSAAYVALRLFTFMQGFAGILVLEWVFDFFKTVILWGPSYFVRANYPLFFLCLLLSSGFNLIPFSPQRRGTEFSLRIGFVMICALALLSEWTDFFLGTNHLEIHQMMLWSATLMSGPALWLVQLIGRSGSTQIDKYHKVAV